MNGLITFFSEVPNRLNSNCKRGSFQFAELFENWHLRWPAMNIKTTSLRHYKFDWAHIAYGPFVTRFFKFSNIVVDRQDIKQTAGWLSCSKL